MHKSISPDTDLSKTAGRYIELSDFTTWFKW